MLKSKIGATVQEVILPDFPDDDNTVTTTVTKSRRVSFGTNFVKEFIVGSAVSAQCIGEYEQAFPSSDSSNADSSHSAAESEISDHSTFMPESHKIQKTVVPTVSHTPEPESAENRTKLPKFSSTICFSADSPTADMEFTEGCITLAKSILDKKNKEMTVIIQAKPKETKDEEKPKEEETKYFDASQLEMSVTRCLKSKENKKEEKPFESEKTKIYGKFEDEMSITRCNEVFNDDESGNSWEDYKENRIPLDMIMRHLDKDASDLENDLFNPEKSFNNLLNSYELSGESEKLNLNESMDISTDFHSCSVTSEKSIDLSSNKLNPDNANHANFDQQPDISENVSLDEPMEICSEEPKMPEEIENPTDDFIVSDNIEIQNDSKQIVKIIEIGLDIQQNMKCENGKTESCLKENVEEVIEIGSENIRQDMSEHSENSPLVEKLNESMTVNADVRANECESPRIETIELEESDGVKEPSLVDLKIVESLKEQSKEPGCLWSLKDLRHPQTKTSGLLSFSCQLLESSTTIKFILKMSNKNSLDSCSIVTNSEITLDEENQSRLPDYKLVIGFGFQELKKSFDDRQQKVENIRHIPYFLDQVNSIMFKMNSYLQQIHSILTLYPGSRLKGSLLSFRLYSFPIFFSCVVSINLTNVFRLSISSLSFENDFGSFDESKIRNIFQECLKNDNTLCKFVIESTKYLIALEKESGYVSKRNHIRFLPVELKL